MYKLKRYITIVLLYLSFSVSPENSYCFNVVLPDESSCKSPEDSSVLFKYSLKGTKSFRKLETVFPLNNHKLSNLSFSGTVDFIAFYRDMPLAYKDMGYMRKNLEFTPYSVPNQFNGNFYRQPLLNLVIGGNTSENSSFAIEYAMSHFFTGQSGDTSRKLSVQNMLQFYGNINTSVGNFLITAGGGAINYSLSPFTIYNKDFREPAFEKLPWDWYTNAFRKYTDFYNSSATTTPGYITNTATQGFILGGSDLPGAFGFSAFYGRTNYTVSPDKAYGNYPLQTFAGKVYKSIDSSGRIGINYYNQFGFTDKVKQIRDKREIITTEAVYKNSNLKLFFEAGTGVVSNPENKPVQGGAINANITIYNRRVKLPLYFQLYSIDKNVAALENAVLNANPSVIQGGYGSDPVYNNGYYPSYIPEVNMMVNNRDGLIFRADKFFRNFRIEFGNAISHERENLYNGVSFEHMVNAFSRSRFKPWIQGVGPYGRISNRYRRSFETVLITDSLYWVRKYYNAAELTIKAKFKVFRREIILSDYLYGGSASGSFSVLPVLNKSSLLHTIYNEMSAYYQIGKDITLVLFYGYQRNIANEATERSGENGLPVNQTGKGYGFGIDYDFAPNAGVFFRHRWMNHKDSNFVLDQFKGQESILEIKIFF